MYSAVIYSASHMRESLWFIWAKVCQRQVAANSKAKLQTWPLSLPVGCYRQNIAHRHWYYYTTIRLILIYRPSEGGRLSRPMALQSVWSPCPKLRIAVIFVKTQDFCPQRDSNLGSLALQASVLPLDHCDMFTISNYEIFANRIVCLPIKQQRIVLSASNTVSRLIKLQFTQEKWVSKKILGGP